MHHLLEFDIFVTVVVGGAFAIIGGLYLLCRHTHPARELTKRKRLLVSNWK